jgi:hypothetical protein
MKRVACWRCGIEHEVQDLEPSYRLPDAIHALAEPVRSDRARLSQNFCVLFPERGADARPRRRGGSRDGDRWFVRVLVPFAVHERTDSCSWGLWAEVAQVTFEEVHKLWNDPNQLEHDPWPATLANDAATFPSTLGLRGSLRFVRLDQIPHFAPSTDQTHRFVEEWKAGVSQERVTEWQMLFVHDGPSDH